jgi:hypothetical protein
MLTAEQFQTELTERLPEIERRLAWLLTRELGDTPSGYGPDVQRIILRNVTQRMAELRDALELAPAPEPVFDATVWS